jgi:hypothetical protein
MPAIIPETVAAAEAVRQTRWPLPSWSPRRRPSRSPRSTAACSCGRTITGRPVSVPLFEVNWLIGAAPGQGKTSAVRCLACGAALDPIADLWVHEHAGKGDLEPLAQVCHRYVSGLDDESIGYAAASLRMLRAELERRPAALKKVDKSERPDGKVTRELASRRSLRLRPIVAIFDEVQNVFMHPQLGAQAADDAAYVIRIGRAYGIILCWPPNGRTPRRCRPRSAATCRPGSARGCPASWRTTSCSAPRATRTATRQPRSATKPTQGSAG